MITRKSLAALAGITLALAIVAGAIGTSHHGVINVISHIAWFGFLACALFLVVASVATIVRHGARRVRSQPQPDGSNHRTD
jgi:nitric oxide reductase large subunit